jgi:hypothetical protein
MVKTKTRRAADLLREAVHPAGESAEDWNPLLDYLGEGRLVLLGEASHGTQEFYRRRATLAKRLILERALRPSRSRPIGRTPIKSIVTSPAAVTMSPHWKR